MRACVRVFACVCGEVVECTLAEKWGRDPAGTPTPTGVFLNTCFCLSVAYSHPRVDGGDVGGWGGNCFLFTKAGRNDSSDRPISFRLTGERNLIQKSHPGFDE